MSAVTNTVVTGTVVRRASALVPHPWPCPGTHSPHALPEEGLLASLTWPPQMWADVKGALGVGGALSWFPSLASLLLILRGLSAVC